MPQTRADELGKIPMSQGLAASLGRAHDYARSQGHRLVTLEHLLYALTDDEDAILVLAASSVDIDRLRSEIDGVLSQSRDPGAAGATAPQVSPELMRIVEYAAAAARQGKRAQVTGAIALAAMIGEGQSAAAGLLKTQGLTFDAAVRALQEQMQAQASGPGPVRQNGAAAPSAEQIIATARERIAASRNQPAGSAAPRAGASGANASTDARGGEAIAPKAAAGAPRDEAHADARAARQESTAPPVSATHDEAARTDPRPPPSRDDAAAGATQPGEQAAGEQHAEPPAPDRHVRPPSLDALQPRHDGPESRHPSWTPPPLPAMRGEPGALGQPPQRPVGEPDRHPDSHDLPDRAPLPDWMAKPPAGGQRAAPATDLPRCLPDDTGLPQGLPPLPSGGKMAGPPPMRARPAPDRAAVQAIRPHRSSAAPALQPGQLAETIPRRMRLGVTATAEVRIGHADSGFSAGHNAGGAPARPSAFITKATSVRLRAPDGGVRIEAASPETQWTDQTVDQLSGDFAVWRFLVTPERRGRVELQLVVAARIVGRDGVMAETTLPDRAVSVRVRANYLRTVARWSGWLALLAIGALIGRLGGYAFDTTVALLSRAAG